MQQRIFFTINVEAFIYKSIGLFLKTRGTIRHTSVQVQHNEVITMSNNKNRKKMQGAFQAFVYITYGIFSLENVVMIFFDYRKNFGQINRNGITQFC